MKRNNGIFSNGIFAIQFISIACAIGAFGLYVAYLMDRKHSQELLNLNLVALSFLFISILASGIKVALTSLITRLDKLEKLIVEIRTDE